MQFQVKYPAHPVGSHKAKTKSRPGSQSLGKQAAEGMGENKHTVGQATIQFCVDTLY